VELVVVQLVISLLLAYHRSLDHRSQLGFDLAPDLLNVGEQGLKVAFGRSRITLKSTLALQLLHTHLHLADKTVLDLEDLLLEGFVDVREDLPLQLLLLGLLDLRQVAVRVGFVVGPGSVEDLLPLRAELQVDRLAHLLEQVLLKLLHRENSLLLDLVAAHGRDHDFLARQIEILVVLNGVPDLVDEQTERTGREVGAVVKAGEEVSLLILVCEDVSDLLDALLELYRCPLDVVQCIEVDPEKDTRISILELHGLGHLVPDLQQILSDGSGNLLKVLFLTPVSQDENDLFRGFLLEKLDVHLENDLQDPVLAAGEPTHLLTVIAPRGEGLLQFRC